MKAIALEICELQQALSERVGPRHARVGTRRRLELRLRFPGHLIGIGEAAPLPGHSPDTLEECRSALEGIDVARLPDLALDDPIAVLDGCDFEAPAAARCALETALLDAHARLRGRPLWWTLRARLAGSTPVPPLLPVAHLIDAPEADRAARLAGLACAGGARTVKLKVGRGLEQDVALVTAVRAAVGSAVQIRIDANRAWTVEQARETLAALRPHRLELVEEAVPWELLTELDDLGLALALDESLLAADAESRLARDAACGVRAVVLKPTLLGGPQRVLRLAARARALGMDAIVSHCFGGVTELGLCTQLAIAVGTPSRAQGIAWHAAVADEPRARLPALSPCSVVRRDAPGLGLDPAAGASAA